MQFYTAPCSSIDCFSLLRPFNRSRGSHSFRVSSPILEAFGKEGLGNTCGGEGKRVDETKVRRERRRRVCTRRGQKRDRWGERMGKRPHNSLANFLVSWVWVWVRFGGFGFSSTKHFFKCGGLCGGGCMRIIFELSNSPPFPVCPFFSRPPQASVGP